MSTWVPEPLVRGHSSRWVRFVIRTLSIRGATWLIFALSLSATVLVCQQAWTSQQERRQARFQADAAILRNAMLERVHRSVQVLQGVRGLFAASEKVEMSEFRTYVASLDPKRDYPGILGLGYIEKVVHANRPVFEHRAADDLGEQGETFRIWPSGDRPVYFAVRFVEPLETNRRTLGFDMASEAARHQAARAAGESGGAALTAKIELIQAQGKPAAILMEPVYATGSAPPTLVDRRQHLVGWVYAEFITSELMDGVQQITRSGLDYEIHDGNSPASDSLLSSSTGGTPAPPDDLEQSTVVDLYGRPWTLRIHAPASHVNENGVLPLGILAAGGLSMSLLILGIAHSMATTSRRACSLAAGMTKELRHQEQALRASEERLAMVIQGSNDGIWDWDVTTGQVYFSARWKGMLGYEEHEIEDRIEAWEQLIHPDDRERALRVLDQYHEGKLPVYQLEHRLRHRDGSYRWILARGVVSRDPDGRPVRMAGSHLDLTGLKQAEQELRLANQELQESQTRLQATLVDLRTSHDQLEKTQLELIQAAKLECVGTLAAGVAHEVKNPLQIIIMGLDYLDQKLGDGEPDTLITLSDMRDAALRANTITRELLQFSSATEFAPVPTPLVEILERSLWLLRSDLTQSGATLVKKLANKLPMIAIDPPKIQQVIINLIHNALQAMGHGGKITVVTDSGPLRDFISPHRLSRCPLRPEDSVVILRLHDSGPGIPDDLLLRIFDPFFTTKAVGTGTGLGLSVVKRIIDLHGGSIHFQNSPHGGLEVTLAFAALDPATVTSPAGPVLMAN